MKLPKPPLFLANSALTGQVRSALASAKTAKIAVAFWGEEALKRLGLDRRKRSIKIICNLESGACNPDEIKLLKKRGFEIRTNRRLHAKVFWTPNAVIAGSANASTNGLAIEGKEGDGWFEAGIVTREARVVTDASRWFDKLWTDTDTRDILPRDLKLADEKWEPRREIRPGRLRGLSKTRQQSILEILKRDPDFFKDRKIFVTAYTELQSKPAKQVFKDVAKRDRLPGKWDFYEDLPTNLKNYPKDSWVIDCHLTSGSEPISSKFWYVPEIYLQQRHRVPREGTLVIPIRGDRKMKGELAVVKISGADKKAILKAVKEVRGVEDNFKPLHELKLLRYSGKK